MVEVVWYGFQGVFGLPTAIVLSLILIFIGGVRRRTRGDRRGRYLDQACIRASRWVARRSGACGDHGQRNLRHDVWKRGCHVVGTGAFTIPLIKKRGFTATFAGAVEAAASTGGQIMPPVMGAGAS
ncbi:MAG: TRAP transporter large permease subunit [Burkholderiaceae bacterium]